MKRSLVLFFAIAFVCCGRSEERPRVPEKVVYRFMDDAQLAEIRELLLARFARGQSGVSELFRDECMCAPGYWQLIASSGIVAPQLRNFEIPNRHSGKSYNLDGAHLEDRNDLGVLARNVASELGRTPRIRRLSTDEIARFWVVVPFDIEEPVFMLESTSRKVVACLKNIGPGEWRIWWIDSLTQYDYGE